MINKHAPPKDLVEGALDGRVAIFERTERINTAWISADKSILMDAKR